jgi:hypothetical protein
MGQTLLVIQLTRIFQLYRDGIIIIGSKVGGLEENHGSFHNGCFMVNNTEHISMVSKGRLGGYGNPGKNGREQMRM